jgi:hypothetical protein
MRKDYKFVIDSRYIVEVIKKNSLVKELGIEDGHTLRLEIKVGNTTKSMGDGLYARYVDITNEDTQKSKNISLNVLANMVGVAITLSRWG